MALAGSRASTFVQHGLNAEGSTASYIEILPIDYAVLVSPTGSASTLVLARAISAVAVQAQADTLTAVTQNAEGLTAVLPLSAAPSGEKAWSAFRVVGTLRPEALAALCSTLAAVKADVVLHAVKPSATHFLCRRGKLSLAVSALLAAGCAVRPLGADLLAQLPPQTDEVSMAELPSDMVGAWRRKNGLGYRLQAQVGLFVEIVEPASGLRKSDTSSWLGSRCGSTSSSGAGNVVRRAIVDFQPPSRLPEGGGPRVVDCDESGEWEHLATSAATSLCLQLESETSRGGISPSSARQGVWIFIGKYFARVIGPTVGSRDGVVSGTLCSSLATLTRIRGKEVETEIQESYEGLFGEVLESGRLRVVHRVGRAALDPLDTVALFYDESNASIGGNVEISGKYLRHTFADGREQSWRIRYMSFNPFVSAPVIVDTPLQELSVPQGKEDEHGGSEGQVATVGSSSSEDENVESRRVDIEHDKKDDIEEASGDVENQDPTDQNRGVSESMETKEMDPSEAKLNEGSQECVAEQDEDNEEQDLTKEEHEQRTSEKRNEVDDQCEMGVEDIEDDQGIVKDEMNEPGRRVELESQEPKNNDQAESAQRNREDSDVPDSNESAQPPLKSNELADTDPAESGQVIMESDEVPDSKELAQPPLESKELPNTAQAETAQVVMGSDEVPDSQELAQPPLESKEFPNTAQAETVQVIMGSDEVPDSKELAQPLLESKEPPNTAQAETVEVIIGSDEVPDSNELAQPLLESNEPPNTAQAETVEVIIGSDEVHDSKELVQPPLESHEISNQTGRAISKESDEVLDSNESVQPPLESREPEKTEQSETVQLINQENVAALDSNVSVQLQLGSRKPENSEQADTCQLINHESDEVLHLNASLQPRLGSHELEDSAQTDTVQPIKEESDKMSELKDSLQCQPRPPEVECEPPETNKESADAADRKDSWQPPFQTHELSKNEGNNGVHIEDLQVKPQASTEQPVSPGIRVTSPKSLEKKDIVSQAVDVPAQTTSDVSANTEVARGAVESGGDAPSKQEVDSQWLDSLVEGSKVKYWSQTVKRWISALVVRRNPDGSFDLDLKRRAQPHFMRSAGNTKAEDSLNAGDTSNIAAVETQATKPDEASKHVCEEQSKKGEDVMSQQKRECEQEEQDGQEDEAARGAPKKKKNKKEKRDKEKHDDEQPKISNEKGESTKKKQDKEKEHSANGEKDADGKKKDKKSKKDTEQAKTKLGKKEKTKEKQAKVGTKADSSDEEDGNEAEEKSSEPDAKAGGKSGKKDKKKAEKKKGKEEKAKKAKAEGKDKEKHVKGKAKEKGKQEDDDSDSSRVRKRSPSKERSRGKKKARSKSRKRSRSRSHKKASRSRSKSRSHSRKKAAKRKQTKKEEEDSSGSRSRSRSRGSSRSRKKAR